MSAESLIQTISALKTPPDGYLRHDKSWNDALDAAIAIARQPKFEQPLAESSNGRKADFESRQCWFESSFAIQRLSATSLHGEFRLHRKFQKTTKRTDIRTHNAHVGWDFILALPAL
jgi:hypothetical protein